MTDSAVTAGREHRADGPASANVLPGMWNISDVVSGEPRVGVADDDIALRVHHRLAERGRALAASSGSRLQVKNGQPAGRAGGRVRGENRESVGTFHQLHRRAPSWVDFNCVRNPVA